MSFEIFFLYDTHCPWSYRAAELINNVVHAHPDVNLHLLHCAYFDGNQKISPKQLANVTENTNYKFSPAYSADADQEKNSTHAANLMAWVSDKSPKQALALLNKLFEYHFEKGASLCNEVELEQISQQLKLSPQKKILSRNKLSKSADATLFEVNEIQQFIGTEAIPAILVAKDDNITLINHSAYLLAPNKIVEAVALELEK